MPQNGEINEKFGIYKSLCCGAEIVINPGALFPDCPNHQKLTTIWKTVPEEKIQPVATHKPDFDDVALHVENRRLFDLASGRLRVEEWEHNHLRECRICQGVLYVLVNQPIKTSTETPPKRDNAA